MTVLSVYLTILSGSRQPPISHAHEIHKISRNTAATKYCCCQAATVVCVFSTCLIYLIKMWWTTIAQQKSNLEKKINFQVRWCKLPPIIQDKAVNIHPSIHDLCVLLKILCHMVLFYGLMGYCSYRCLRYFSNRVLENSDKVCSHRSVCLCSSFCNVKFRACFKKQMFNAKKSLTREVPLETYLQSHLLQLLLHLPHKAEDRFSLISWSPRLWSFKFNYVQYRVNSLTLSFVSMRCHIKGFRLVVVKSALPIGMLIMQV